jgi:hypothetical protein
MNGSSGETQFRCTVEWAAECLAMALVSLMVVVSTLRLFGILS